MPAELMSAIEFEEMVKEQQFSMQSVNRVPMFRTGDYGEKGRYDTKDLDAMASSYNPDYLMAPVTPDHMQYGPALGWITKVYREGDMLFGDWKLHPDTVDLIKQGKYTRRSIEFYRRHEMPDGEVVPYVKACSILGAATPHAKGMPDIKFDAADEAVAFDFEPAFEGDNTPPPVQFKEVATMPQGNGKFTSLADAEAEIARLAKEKEESDAEAKRLAEENKKLDTRLTSNEQMTAKLLADARKRDAEKQFDEVVEEFRENVTPAVEPLLRTLYVSLTEMPEDAQVSFTEKGQTEAQTMHPANLLLEVVAKLPKVVSLSGQPLGNNDKIHKPGKIAVNKEDPEAGRAFSEKLAARADEIQRENPEMSYTECMVRADKELRA